MTKFLDPSFSSRPASAKYRDNWDATFKAKRKRCKCVDVWGDGKCDIAVTSKGNLCDWCIKICKKEQV